MIYIHTTAKSRIKKDKAKKEPIHGQDCQLLRTPLKRVKSHPWESDDWYSSFTDDSSTSTTARCNSRHFAWTSSISLDLAHHPTHVVLDLGCIRSIGSKKSIRRLKKCALYHGIKKEFCPYNKSFVFANSQKETSLESCIINITPTPPCSTIVDVLETGDVPVVFSLPHMKNLGYDY